MDHLQSVLRLAGRGWRLFPIRAGAKAPPLVADWEHVATDHPGRLTAWAEKWPGCNWAVACGPSNLFVVDLDTKNGKAGPAELTKLELDHDDLPVTMTARTPSGGTHLIFQGQSASSVERLGAGIDIRSAGGYILVAPSLTEAGAYVIEDADVPPAPAPAWIVDLAGQPVVREEKDPGISLEDPATIARARDYLASRPGAVEGQGGDAYTFQTACAIKDIGVSQSTALELLFEWNRKCSPPWNDTELEAKIAHAWAYGKHAPGCASPQAAFANVEPMPEASDVVFVSQAEAKKEAKKEEIHLDIRCAKDLDPAAIPAREWVLGYRFIRGYITVTIAPGGVGKSTLSIVEALAIATDRPLTGEPIKESGSGVWLYNTEDPVDELERRIYASAKFYGISRPELGRLYYTSGRNSPLVLVSPDERGRPQTNTDAVDACMRFIEANNVSVMCVDPFVRTHRVDENDNMAIDQVAQAFTRICSTTGCAVHIVHHTRKRGNKGGEGDMDMARGASSLISAARISHTLCGMSEKEYQLIVGEIGREPVKAKSHKYYVRLDDAKANMGPPTDHTTWFRKHGVAIGEEQVGTLERVELKLAEKVAKEDE